MVMRTCCIGGVEQYKIHWLAAMVIFAGVIVSFLTLTVSDKVSASFVLPVY